jgi:hypothetical protein
MSLILASTNPVVSQSGRPLDQHSGRSDPADITQTEDTQSRESTTQDRLAQRV